jgi:hypothetical protein
MHFDSELGAGDRIADYRYGGLTGPPGAGTGIIDEVADKFEVPSAWKIMSESVPST